MVLTSIKWEDMVSAKWIRLLVTAGKAMSKPSKSWDIRGRIQAVNKPQAATVTDQRMAV